MDKYCSADSSPLQSKGEDGGNRNPFPDPCRPSGRDWSKRVRAVEWEERVGGVGLLGRPAVEWSDRT